MCTLTKKVLLLSKSYEPIAFCSVRKAINLVMLEKADTVELLHDIKILGVSKSFDCPSIIRLKQGPTKTKMRLHPTKRNIFKRDGFRCVYCGDKSQLTIDHVIPKSKGGKTIWENLVTACNSCNNLKDNKELHEVGFELKTNPRVPNRIVFMRQEVGLIEEIWKPYLYLT